MKRLITILLLVACASVLSTCYPAYAQGRAQSPSWQGSTEAAVRLTVRDKYATLDGYQATFTVTAADGKSYYSTGRAKGSRW